MLREAGPGQGQSGVDDGPKVASAENLGKFPGKDEKLTCDFKTFMSPQL
jgi:hypothetical protein